jgi:4-diphosphocytidyl-2-C-methyl-D-erythritol kinase
MSYAFNSFIAPAKLNLTLSILGRRLDGYHNLCTVFRLIDLADQINIALSDQNDITLLEPFDGILPHENLVFRAAHLIKQVTGYQKGAVISIKKNIPIGAGLGGGSSDAATTLIALNQLWKTQLQKKQLMQLAVSLGADVPVFIFGKNALATGIGEKLVALTLPKRWYLLLHPPVHIKTREMFTGLELTRSTPPAIISALLNPNLRVNDLEPTVRKKFALVDQAMETLTRYGAARMSGSGSCVFLECLYKKNAHHIAKQCVGRWDQYLVRGLMQHPLLTQMEE